MIGADENSAIYRKRQELALDAVGRFLVLLRGFI